MLSLFSPSSLPYTSGLVKPKLKRPKIDSDGELIPPAPVPYADPTPLEVLNRFTLARDEELPQLVWDLVDEVSE